MWKLHNTWRDQQLAVFQKNCADTVVIQQDQDLVNFINTNHYTTAFGYGDVEYFSQYITFINTGIVDFCIFIINTPFEFGELVEKINHVIQHNVNKHGILYLAINKFLAFPLNYSHNVDADYDQLLYQFIKEQVNAEIMSYDYVHNDRGQMFNFVHPLTRFYLKV